jgi:hypothetical protein
MFHDSYACLHNFDISTASPGQPARTLARSCVALNLQLIACTYSHSDYYIDPPLSRAQTYNSTAVNAVKSRLR